MVDSPAIWKTNPDNSWRLYNQTDYKPKEIQPAPKENKDKKGSPTQTKPQVSTPFSFSKSKPLTKGSTVCTAKGYGILQAFNEDKGTITVKIEGQTLEFPQDEVLSDIPLDVVFMNNSLRTEEIVYVPITSTMSEFIERMENSLSENDNLSAVSLYSKGKGVASSTDTLEKLKVLPWTKFLGILKAKKPLAVKRYPIHATGWSLSPKNTLGVAFSPSKTIKIIGFGIYKPSSGKMNGDLNFYEGTSMKREALEHRSLNITETQDKEDLEKVMFSKPIVIKAGEFGSVTLMVYEHCMCHYGSGGQQSISGEGEVNFMFKTLDDIPFSSGFDSGQFPEIYYYA